MSTFCWGKQTDWPAKERKTTLCSGSLSLLWRGAIGSCCSSAPQMWNGNTLHTLSFTESLLCKPPKACLPVTSPRHCHSASNHTWAAVWILTSALRRCQKGIAFRAQSHVFKPQFPFFLLLTPVQRWASLAPASTQCLSTSCRLCCFLIFLALFPVSLQFDENPARLLLFDAGRQSQALLSGNKGTGCWHSYNNIFLLPRLVLSRKVGSGKVSTRASGPLAGRLVLQQRWPQADRWSSQAAQEQNESHPQGTTGTGRTLLGFHWSGYILQILDFSLSRDN